jgi:hypothetical protein
MIQISRKRRWRRDGAGRKIAPSGVDCEQVVVEERGSEPTFWQWPSSLLCSNKPSSIDHPSNLPASQ